MIGLKLAQIHLGKGTTGMLELIKCFWLPSVTLLSRLHIKNLILISFFPFGEAFGMTLILNLKEFHS